MNNKLLKGAVVASGVLLLTACNDSFSPSNGDRSGRILPSVDVDTSVAAPAESGAKVKSRAQEELSVSVADLSLRLESADGSVAKAWDSAIDFPANAEYPVGDYTLEAFYGVRNEEGFSKPYFYGSTNLTVLENRTTPVNLTASLANAIVTVKYSDALKGYFSSYNATVVTSAGGNFEVTPAEERLLYVNSGSVTINVDVVRPTGVSATLNPFSFIAEARHHYFVTFDINNGDGGGSAFLTVTFNSDMVEEEVEVNVSDQVLSASAPFVTLKGVDGTPDFIEGTSPAEKLTADIVAHGGLKTAVLTTSSASLLAKGWPAEVDFATADAATLATLRQLGLETIGLDGTGSVMGRLDFTDVVRNISYIEGGDNTTSFAIVAKDNLSKISEPVSFSFTVSKMELAIVSAEPLYPEATELTLNVEFNGADIADVAFAYKNELGIWSPLKMKSAAVSARAANTYKVVLEVPATGDIELKATCGSVSTPNSIVRRSNPDHSLAVNANNVFATRATGTLSMSNGADAASSLAQARLYLSADGAAFSEVNAGVSGNSFTLTNLRPATAYALKASLNGVMSQSVNFTTEAATQLPNAGMEDWVITASESHWELYYPASDAAASVWGTNNPMTTSPSGIATNYAYDKISGTKPTDDGHSGKAARISTQGWGSGNSALSGVSGACKYIDPGMLHLGASRTARPEGYSDRAGSILTDDLDCGIAFASRPSSLGFWYKYERKNDADRGVARAYVYDAAGNVIASGTLDLDKQDTYAMREITLDYAPGAAKAAKIYVCFLSTNTRDALVKDGSWLNGPGFANVSRGEYSGSRLYIDDITLNY